MFCQVTALALAPVAESAQTAKFLAIALDDQTVRVISLDQNSCLQPLNMQALPNATATSLCIVEVQGAPGEPASLSLNIGLENGVLMRSTLDNVTADLSNTRTRYLGARPVKLFTIKVNGEQAVLALSAKPWLCYRFQVT
jgi:splicing factor 3B subunit 3